jgi:ABC-type antimicrobial peptide transport system permease subunit
VVNQTMAERFWRGADPVAKRFRVNGRWLQVVGVARNSKYRSVREAPQPYFYTPLRQGSSPGQSIQIRTRLGSAVMANMLAREVKALDASLAPTELISMREQIDRTSWSQRAAFTLLTTFGVMALLLAAVGLYGVISYAVSQRTRELGLRMALGAEGFDLLWMMMRYGIGLTIAGMAVGVGLALGTTRLMGDLLYKVSPRDPAVFAGAFIVMAFATFVACLIPALPVMRTDPVRALRGE